MSYPFLKGHGTENDFVLLPDADGTVHGDLTAERVRALCDRRAGIGGDGVLRVVRTDATDDPAAADARDAEWFMDYRNADGSLAEMCGNGIRVFALHLVDAGPDVDPRDPVPIATRDGVKTLTFDGDRITVDMGTPSAARRDQGRRWATGPGRRCTSTWATRTPSCSSTTSPRPARCSRQPAYDAALYPDGVNVEFVVRRGERPRRDARARARLGGDPLVRHRRLRGDGRGRGRRRSGPGRCTRSTYRAARSSVAWTDDDRILLTGPAVIVARGVTDL